MCFLCVLVESAIVNKNMCAAKDCYHCGGLSSYVDEVSTNAL